MKNDDFKFSLIELKEKKNQVYHTFVLLAGFLIYGIGVFHLKLITRMLGRYDPYQLLFYRCIMISIISYIYLKKSKINIEYLWDIQSNLLLIFRNLMSFLATISFLQSLNYLRLSTCVIFTSLAPVFTCVLSVLILKEKFHSRYIVGILMCLSGSLILVINEKSSQLEQKDRFANSTVNYVERQLSNLTTFNDGFEISNNKCKEQLILILIGCFFGIAHSLSLSFQYTYNKMLLNLKIENNILLFYLGVIVGGFSLIGSFLFSGNFNQFFNFSFILNGLINGIIFYYALFLNNVAYSKVDLISTAGVSYILTVESFILGSIFLNEPVYLLDILGTLLILSYNFYNAFKPLKK